MRPKRDPVPRAKEAWIWLGSTLVLGILGAGVVGAALLLWQNIDIRQLTHGLEQAPGPLPLPDPPRSAAIDDVTFTAVLFNSPRNEGFFPDSAYYPTELERWRDLIREVGGELREASDAGELRAVSVEEVLVLAEAPCLSPTELAAVRAHISDGGSVVSNWAVGVRDADCEWRGWATLLDLTEAEEVQELPSREGLFLTVPAGIALASGFDPGTRIELRPDPSLALRMQGPRVCWSDWALNPAPDEDGFGTDVAATATRTPEGGRTAWFGLRVGQAATPTDSIHLRRLVQNGVLWAAGTATATTASWPGAARAALVLTLDVEAQPRNAMDVAALFEAEELPGTFFVVTQLVLEDDALAEALMAVGEVASQTRDHTPIAGLTAQSQRVRLRRSWLDIERWTGTAPAGLRPPEEAFDSVTLRAWQQAGGEYILARNEARSASPEIHRTEDGVIVVLPRLLKDDYNVIVQDRALRSERISEAFLEGMRKLHAIGGLAVVAGHTQIMESGRRLEAFRVVADTARMQGDWWIARADEVATWWRARSGVDVDFVPAGQPPQGVGTSPSGLSDIVVHGLVDEPLRDVWVDVVLSAGSESLIPFVDGRSVDFAATEWGIRVPVGALAAGEDRRISLVVVQDEGDEAVSGA